MADAKSLIDDGPIAGLLGGAAVLWRARPDPEAYVAGKLRAARPILVGVIVASLGATVYAATSGYYTAIAATSAPGLDAAGVAGLALAVLDAWSKPILFALAALGATTALLAVRRRARRNADRVEYVLTTDDLAVVEGRGAARYALDSIFEVGWRPGKHGPARGQVIAKIRPTADDMVQTLSTGRTVRLYGVAEPERIRRLIEAAIAGTAAPPAGAAG